MVELDKILLEVDIVESVGDTDRSVKSVHFDSRKVGPGDMFIATRGTKADGHEFIEQALKNGATVVVCEKIPEQIADEVTWIIVKDSLEALGRIASSYYNNPSNELKIIGITGTNGKTTIATLLHNLFIDLGYRAGLVSTIRNLVNREEHNATLTTPDPVELNRLIRLMVNNGCSHVFMEVSSHAVNQKRVEGIRFAGGVFTNLTHDHLDYHQNFDEYLRVKKRFFDNLPKDSFALVNADDRNGKVMLQNCRAKHYTYALKILSDFNARILENRFEGMLLKIAGNELSTKFIGEFNASNLLAVFTVARLLGIEEIEALTSISRLEPVKGRLQLVRSVSGKTGIVDYAHTPDAISNVVAAINRIRKNGMRLITVLGAGGDRDRTKRAPMARAAIEGSDTTILTSDNPRNENPEIILDDMMEGLDPELNRKVLRISDRREAIKAAVSMANDGDIILVAGKGHETYQEIKGKRYHFDDIEELKKMFE